MCAHMVKIRGWRVDGERIEVKVEPKVEVKVEVKIVVS